MKKVVTFKAIFFLLQFICFEVICKSDGTIAPMEEKEKEALYLTIQGFVGKWWNGSLLYPDPCGWTPIQGVSCDFFGNNLWYVTTINIGLIFDNSLKCSNQAEFSPYLFELTNLKSISIINCFKSNPTNIPVHNWNKISSTLQSMEFRSNKELTGNIPPILGQLVNLQSLILTENSLSGEIPLELGNLISLKRLTLSENKLSGKLPVSLGAKLANLLIIDMSCNFLSGPLHSSFGYLTSLLKLDLSNNFLSGVIPQELGNLKNLTLLDLRNNNLTGSLDPSLQGMISLEDIALSNNPLGGKIQDFDWTSLKNLTHLDLSNTNLIGKIPDSITELKKLRFIALNNNQLSGFVSTKFAAMSCLNALYLNGNNLSGELRFSEEFYGRMGRKFSSWGNSNLCYEFGDGNRTGQGPFGVDRCVYEENRIVFDLNSENLMGSVEKSKSIECMSSTAFSAYFIARFVWITFLDILIILFLFCLL